MVAFTDLRDQLALYLEPQHLEKITEAYMVAEKAHRGQKRLTGEDYITHPLEVARILANMHVDHQCIMAAMLHDVIEDTSIDKDEITKLFGEKVAGLVDGVSKLKLIRFKSKEQAQAENFRKMMMAMSDDIRVIIIKLADRLHNMRTLGGLPNYKKRRVARETLEIYAPIAHRLGMNNMRMEFEDLGFQALYPLRYRILKLSVKRTKGNRRALLSKIENKLAAKLEEHEIKAEILAREKHLYSIYRKMQKKRLSFSEIMDVYAIRVIVSETKDCYLALGLVHSSFTPIFSRFKDYIAMPKTNGYQSIHTTLIGPDSIPIEVQIRTKAMNDIADHGIASHWLYKTEENTTLSLETTFSKLQAREWLKGLLDIQKTTKSPIEFIENVKMDLYSAGVFVFTPKGKILSLPIGATAVDFAYLVHTDVGNSCIACKIDRKLSPLSTRLQNGQTIEIITAKGVHPNPSWLSFVVTGKARANIRNWLKNQERIESQNLGKRLINAVLANYNLSCDNFDDLKSKNLLNQAIAQLNVDSLEDLYEEVGLGKRMALLVAEIFINIHSQVQKLSTGFDLPSQQSDTIKPLIITGTEGLVVTYASCCYPIPGDLIVGHLSAGKGIVIHTDNCKKLLNFRKSATSRDNFINVTWEKELQGVFQVPILIDVINARGVLASLAKCVSETNANIVNVNVDEQDGLHNTVQFILEVRNRAHLARVMRRLRQVGEVTKILRGKQ